MKNSNKNIVTDTEKEILSYNSYHLDKPIKLDGWQMIYKESKPDSGFEGQIYQKNNNVIIVYKGTNDKNDIINSDINMLFGYNPKQQKDAHNLFLKAQYIYKDENVNIETTGHSLGGSLAQIESARTGVKATTFNAFGTSKILKNIGYTNEEIRTMNIKNYGNPKDPIFNFNSMEQPGRTFITNTVLNTKQIYQMSHGHGNFNIKYHNIEQMDRLENAVEVTPKDQNKNSQNLYHAYTYKINDIYNNVHNPNFKNIPMAIPRNLKSSITTPTGFAADIDVKQLANLLNFQSANIEIPNLQRQALRAGNQSGFSGYTNPLTGNNRIFTREDVKAMSPDEFAKYEKEIDAQIKSMNGEMPTNNDLRTEAITGGGVVYVNSYTRSDGTRVKSYFRSRGIY